MTITIYEGYDKSYIILGSKNEDFIKAYGRRWEIPTSNLYKNLEQISAWCNNVVGEECLFEVD